MRWIASLAIGAALFAGSAACKPKPTAAAKDAKAKLSVVVRATPDSNAGRPVYVVVRAVEEQGFDVDGYREMTALVMKPDPTVLGTFLVFPGMTALNEIELAELPKVVGVYCLFTETVNDQWKVMFQDVEVIDVTVTANQIMAK